MNITGIKKHIQETKRKLKEKPHSYKIKRKLMILQRVLKSKQKKKRQLKNKK